jgi:hypothetical protein
MVFARDFFAEPLLRLLISALLFLAFRNDAKSLRIIAVLSALTVLGKPTALLAGPIISVYLFANKRSLWSSSWPTISTAVGFALYCGYNYYRFRNFLQFGKRLEGSALAPSLSYVPEGIVGQLFSPGAGLVWYCPCVVLSILGMKRLSPSRLLEALAGHDARAAQRIQAISQIIIVGRGLTGCEKSRFRAAFSSTPACAGFAALIIDAQPRVAVLLELFRSRFTRDIKTL